MKLQIVKKKGKQFAGKHCTICNKGAIEGQEVLVLTIPNFGFAFVHTICAAPLFEQSNEATDKRVNEIRQKFIKENHEQDCY